MIPVTTDARRAAACVLFVMFASVGGCATLQRSELVAEPGTAGDSTTTSPNLPPSHPQPDSAGREAVLAAVEQFLERTRDFQVEHPPADPGRPSAASTVTAASTPVGNDESPSRNESRSNQDGFPREAGRGAVANVQVDLPAAATALRSPDAGVSAVPVIKRVTVRPLAEPTAPQASPARTQAVNEPLSTGGDESFDIVERFLRAAEEEAQQSPGFESFWRLRLAQLALDQPLPAERGGEHLPPNVRDMMSRFITVAEEIRGLARLPEHDRSTAIRAVDELRTTVSDGAELTIPTVALCRKVLTYGVYEPMEKDAFVAGRPVQSIVYIELAHFRSEEVDGPTYRTRLGTDLELLTLDGQSVWRHDEPEIEDECQRRRTDFFLAQRVSFPPTLPAGDYVLKVRVEDRLSGRLAETSLPLSLVSALSAGRLP